MNTLQISNSLENVKETYLTSLPCFDLSSKEKSLRVSPQNNRSDNSGVLEVQENTCVSTCA